MSLETPNAFADEENILLHTALFKQGIASRSRGAVAAFEACDVR